MRKSEMIEPESIEQKLLKMGEDTGTVLLSWF